METIQMLGSLGEFVGAIAVVATLVYLAIQVRHSKEAMEANTRSLTESRQAMVAQTAQARLYRQSERAEKFAESEHVARIQLQLDQAGFPDDPSSVERLDPLDRLRMREWNLSWRHHLANSALQFELGYAREEGREDFKRAVDRYFQGPMKAFGIEPGGILTRLLAEAEAQS